MSQRRITVAALLTAAAVLLAGVVFAVARDRDYESIGTVVLSPNPNQSADRISTLLESFERSGTLGTYVELMASDDVTEEARDSDVSITVRAVPDTRAIRIIAKGGEEDVQPAVDSVVTATRARQNALNDLFTIEILESPSAPSLAGPPTVVILLASLLLAVFAAIAVVALLRRLAPPDQQMLQYKVPRPESTAPRP